jgi:hypothetical protein
MAHITTLGASIYSDLAVATGVVTANVAASSGVTTVLPDTLDMHLTTGFPPLFADEDAVIAGSFRRVANVREFPNFGTPANIVKVPAFGQKQSSQVNGQADAPTLELTINYVATDWTTGATGTVIGNMVADGIARVWRFTLLNVDSTNVAGDGTKYASSAAGLGTVPNSQFFWLGKLESLLVKPSLTDATTATVTLSIVSDFYGAFTI